MKFKFHGIVEWKEEIDNDDLQGMFADSDDEPTDDDLEDWKQRWLKERAEACKDDMMNVPEDAKVISLEIDEVTK